MNIVILNKTTVVSDEDLQKAIAAIQIQVTRDFYPLWSIDASLSFSVDKPTDGTAYITMMDTSDVEGALGYHTDDDGCPYGKVFAKDDEKYGLSWSVTLSHETLELLADPDAIQTITGVNGKEYALEVCDAVEDDSYAYEIDGVKVSNFVTRNWFEGNSAPTLYDFLRKCDAPGELLPGGYISIEDAEGNWSEVYHQEVKNRSLRQKETVRPDSRTARHKK